MFSFENELNNEVTAVVPQDTSNKSVQKEEQVPTNLHLQTNMNEVPRCVMPSGTIYDELLDSDAEISSSNMQLKVFRLKAIPLQMIPLQPMQVNII